MRRRAYYNGAEEYLRDNFPLLENSDLASRMDIFEEKNRDGTPLENEDQAEEKLEKGEELQKDDLEPTEDTPGLYTGQHGVEGLFYLPLDGGQSAGIAGGISEEPDSILDNPYSTVYQNASPSIQTLEKLARKFVWLAHNPA